MVYREHVLSVRDYFIGINIWGSAMQLNPSGWIANFEPADRDLAAHLMNGYIYLNSDMVSKQFETGFRRIVSGELDERSSNDALSRWRSLRDTAQVSFPTTHPTDSGHQFVQATRDRFGVPEDRIHDLPDLRRHLYAVSDPPPVVLVDDFTGTGNQFVRSVTSKGDGNTPSLIEEIARLGIVDAYFVVAVATDSAKRRIESDTPFTVSAGNILPSTASILDAETHLVPPDQRDAARELVERYSSRAGIEPEDVWGYERSGLALSFAHKTPNNTLPIFTKESPRWTPLIRH